VARYRSFCLFILLRIQDIHSPIHSSYLLRPAPDFLIPRDQQRGLPWGTGSGFEPEPAIWIAGRRTSIWATPHPNLNYAIPSFWATQHSKPELRHTLVWAMPHPNFELRRILMWDSPHPNWATPHPNLIYTGVSPHPNLSYDAHYLSYSSPVLRYSAP
jgi:hypothetical protein